jgi:hypothetical protein
MTIAFLVAPKLALRRWSGRVKSFASLAAP